MAAAPAARPDSAAQRPPPPRVDGCAPRREEPESGASPPTAATETHTSAGRDAALPPLAAQIPLGGAASARPHSGRSRASARGSRLT